ncbi:MAG: PP2C family protein-serine/threonine phosphatase [Nocardioides sp.]
MDPTPLSLRYAALSDVGRVRKNNQDSGFAGPHLLMVADGVGGAARGDIASSTAVQILRRLDAPPPDNMQEAMAGAIHRAHDRLAELVDEDPELDGTSTTITAALFDGTKITVGHVGDSRGYLLREGTLSRLTKDHTFVQGLIDEGRITEEESRTHPHRNLILRAVDGVHETDPDLFDVELAPGDRILLCSDGCSGVLDDDRIADILGTGSVDYAAVELIRASLDAGSSDNVTAVVADVVDEAAAEPDTGAAATTGPMLVGAAAEQPRKQPLASKSFFRGHRGGDTGEMEPVPGDPATGAEVDPETLRYAPRPPRRFKWVRRFIALGVLLAVLVGAGALAYSWSQDQYYVAVADQKVVIFRGIQSDIPGLTMHRVAETTDVTVQSLPAYRAEQVRAGIPADSLERAREIAADIRTDFARKCPTPEPSPTAEPSKASKSPSADATGKKSSKKKPSAKPSPTPSPSPTIAPPDCIEASPSAGAGS